ncbi:MAG: PqqD family protein [Cyanobacteria bacterium J06554_11]
MEKSTLLKVNEPDVVSETIDGETVVVSLSTGSYYSLEGSATMVWNLIEAGYTLEQILSVVNQHFEAEPTTIETAVEALVEQLQAEALVVESDGSEVNASSGDSSQPLAAVPSVPQKFVFPTLQKFSDMQELLLLDPIHEVDQAAGWPAKAAETAEVEA